MEKEAEAGRTTINYKSASTAVETAVVAVPEAGNSGNGKCGGSGDGGNVDVEGGGNRGSGGGGKRGVVGVGRY
jgi:hypothetical protein